MHYSGVTDMIANVFRAIKYNTPLPVMHDITGTGLLSRQDSDLQVTVSLLLQTIIRRVADDIVLTCLVPSATGMNACFRLRLVYPQTNLNMASYAVLDTVMYNIDNLNDCVDVNASIHNKDIKHGHLFMTLAIDIAKQGLVNYISLDDASYIQGCDNVLSLRHVLHMRNKKAYYERYGFLQKYPQDKTQLLFTNNQIDSNMYTLFELNKLYYEKTNRYYSHLNDCLDTAAMISCDSPICSVMQKQPTMRIAMDYFATALQQHDPAACAVYEQADDETFGCMSEFLPVGSIRMILFLHFEPLAIVGPRL